MSLFQSDAGAILKAFVDSPVQEQTVKFSVHYPLAFRMFSRSDSKTQTQYLTKSTSPDEFKFQLYVALLVDFLKSHIKRPLLKVGPKFKRRVLNDSS